MNYELLIIFIVLNVANVVIQTVKTLATVNCGKWGASLTNALAYGLYTVVVVYTVCDLPLMLKAGIVAVANLIGVYVVKLIEEKSRKDKLWKIEIAIPSRHQQAFAYRVKDIPHNYQRMGKWVMFNCYCPTKEDSRIVKNIAKEYGGKISAYESKQL